MIECGEERVDNVFTCLVPPSYLHSPFCTPHPPLRVDLSQKGRGFKSPLEFRKIGYNRRLLNHHRQQS